MTSPAKSFAIGDRVYLKRFRRHGTVVTLDGRIASVQLDSITVRCRIEELEAARDDPQNLRPDGSGEGYYQQPKLLRDYQRSRRSLESLDLHAMTVDEAMRAVENHLDRVILAGLDRVQLIHGISGGKIKAALDRLLSTLAVVKHFKSDSKNAGITWVYF